MNRGFVNIAIVIALVVIVGGAGWWYMNKSSVPATSETNQLPTQETQQNTNAQTPLKQSPPKEASTPVESRTYSTVVSSSNNYSSQAYLEGWSEVAANSEWKGTLVIPQDVVGKAGNADINWGDGKVDTGGEIGQTGNIWNFRGTDRVVVSHTYVKPGTYQIQVSLWLLTGYASDGGQQQTMLSIKRPVTVK